MDERLQQAFIKGVERVAAWSDLLDEINVYPVADGDTGRNLSMSLTPLRFAGGDKDEIVRKLLLSARGNSGNIASQFFSGFYTTDTLHDLKTLVQEGNARAWKAQGRPRLGTMLSLFDALEEIIVERGFSAEYWLISNRRCAKHEKPCRSSSRRVSWMPGPWVCMPFSKAFFIPCPAATVSTGR